MSLRRSDTLVRVIGGLKLLKAAVLLALGVCGLTTSGVELSRLVSRALAWFGIFAGRDFIASALHRLVSLDFRAQQRLAVLSLAYSAVFLVEGIGLLARKRWAEWMTVVVTASFIPFEIYEMTEGFGVGKVLTLILNVLIVIYLLWRRIEERRSLAARMSQALRLV
ncbi:MAG: DUF2127 domain-containing protein [Myxococcales bacterium]